VETRCYLRIVDPHRDLEPGGQVGTRSSDETDERRSGGADEPSGRGDGDQSSDGAGTEPNDAPFPLQPEIEDHPDDPSDGPGEVGVERCHGCLQVGGKGATGVETEPSDPEEHCAEDDVTDVVGFVENSFGPVATSLADEIRVGESTDPRGDLDGDATGVYRSTRQHIGNDQRQCNENQNETTGCALGLYSQS
jgi:hypothetical protein